MARFQWDENKNKINIEKHGIDFNEASQVFDDESRRNFLDNRKDYGEIREISIGKINLGSINSIIIVVVVHTERDGFIRIISARKANKNERFLYEKQ
ncbi:BrnT family toxin [Nostocales cyanobacterium LEGE 11386]|nr:BrnT family toxin [Nostocales cyanobacterium LEGE 11386]